MLETAMLMRRCVMTGGAGAPVNLGCIEPIALEHGEHSVVPAAASRRAQVQLDKNNAGLWLEVGILDVVGCSGVAGTGCKSGDLEGEGGGGGDAQVGSGRKNFVGAVGVVRSNVEPSA